MAKVLSRFSVHSSGGDPTSMSERGCKSSRRHVRCAITATSESLRRRMARHTRSCWLYVSRTVVLRGSQL